MVEDVPKEQHNLSLPENLIVVVGQATNLWYDCISERTLIQPLRVYNLILGSTRGESIGSSLPTYESRAVAQTKRTRIAARQNTKSINSPSFC